MAKQAPPVGTIEDDHMFMGGDAATPENWRPIEQIQSTINASKGISTDDRSYTEKVASAPKKVAKDVSGIGSKLMNFASPVLDYAADIGTSAAQGLTLDALSSLGARFQQGLDFLSDKSITDNDADLAAQGFTGDLVTDQQDLYKKAKEEEDQRIAQARERAGVAGDIAHFAGEMATTHVLSAPIAGIAKSVPIAGKVISEGLKPTKSLLDAYREGGLVVGAGKEIGKRMIGEAVGGSIVGGVTGLAQTQGDLTTEEGLNSAVEDATSGAIVGGGIGAAGGLAGGLIGIGAQKGKEFSKGLIESAKTSEYPLMRRVAKSLEKGWETPKSLSTEVEQGTAFPKPGEESEMISGKEIHKTTQDADKLTAQILDSENKIIGDMNKSLEKARADGISINLDRAAAENPIINAITPIDEKVLKEYEKQQALSIGSGIAPKSPIKIPDEDTFVLKYFNGDQKAFDAIKKVIDNQHDPVAFKSAYDELRNVIGSYAKSGYNGNVAEQRVYERLLNIKDKFKQALKESTDPYGFGLHSDRLSYLRKNVNESVLGIKGQYGKQVYYAHLPNRENVLRDSIETIISSKGPEADQLKSQLLYGLKDQAEGEAALARIGRTNNPAIPGFQGSSAPSKAEIQKHLFDFSENLKHSSDIAAISKKIKRTGWDSHANFLNQGIGTLTHASPSTEGKAYGTTEFIGRYAKKGTDWAANLRNMPDRQIEALASRIGGPVGDLFKKGLEGNSLAREQAIFLTLQNPKYKKYLDETPNE